MILNVIDRRARPHRWKRRPHRWKRVNAIIEDAWHDNTVEDADQAPQSREDEGIDDDERRGVSVAEAVAWASALDAAVTLYLYDEGAGV